MPIEIETVFDSTAYGMTLHQALKELERVAAAYANGAEEKTVKRIAAAVAVLRLALDHHGKQEATRTEVGEESQAYQPNLL
jgi:hypothetical protein